MSFFRILNVTLLALILTPSLSFGAELYRPDDTQMVYIRDIGNFQYELSIHLNSGQLFKFDNVAYSNSRANFLEDIAREVNSHRKFTSFDDEDVRDLIVGDIPFGKGDIQSGRAIFTETSATVTLRYKSGDSITVDRAINEKFIAPVEVAELVVDMLTDAPGVAGSFTTDDIFELIPDFEGIEYYAPEVTRIEAQYNTENENIDVHVYFENNDEREFTASLKPTKQQITEDIALLITEFYTEREGGVLLRSDISDKITWIDIPRTADDIEKIVVSRKNDEAIWAEVSTILDNLSRAYTLFEIEFEGTLDTEESLAIVISDTLENNAKFAPDFDINDIAARIETGDIDFSRYEVQGENGQYTLEAEPDVVHNDEVENNDTSTEGEVSDEETDTNEETESLYQALLALILLYIQQNGLDIDVSGL